MRIHQETFQYQFSKIVFHYIALLLTLYRKPEFCVMADFLRRTIPKHCHLMRWMGWQHTDALMERLCAT